MIPTPHSGEGHEVFNPAAVEAADGEHIVSAPSAPPWQSKVSLRRVFSRDMEYICLYADAIALLPGWEKSYGARAEWALAVALGHKIIYLDSVLQDNPAEAHIVC